MLVCATCSGVIEFGSDGWVHSDPDRECAVLVVAFPPPLHDEVER